ncbi:MAG TPA: phospholipase D-like domain-containing protein [Ktedonobacteraceae bacterium]
MQWLSVSQRTVLFQIIYLLACWYLLTGCALAAILPAASATDDKQCQSNCALGSGAQGLRILVEPDMGPAPIVSAIRAARQTVFMEMYLLSNKSIIAALEEDANQGLDVRVMLEQHPYGGTPLSPQETLARLQAAGVKTRFSNPDFPLTHEKGLLIDNAVAYIMTSNMTNAALGVGNYTLNREYDIVDTNTQDVQAIAAIFQADWQRGTVSFNAPDLVVSPLNARLAFNLLIASASQTLLVTAEEMQDSGIEQDLIAAAQRAVNVQVILPTPGGGSSDSNLNGILAIKQGGVHVREDPRLYMHAKTLIVDGQRAFVGSENISTPSLDQNRELGIIIADGSVLQTLQQTFQKDWNDSQSV